MSGHYWPLTCVEVKTLLKRLGFEPQPQKGTSHENWIGYIRGKYRKVTIDCPKSPFTQQLILWMAHQAGLTKKEFYSALNPDKAELLKRLLAHP